MQILAGLFIAVVAAKTSLLVLEEIPKTNLLQHTITSQGANAPETVGGLFNRTLFWWLNSVFKKGYSSLISIANIPPMRDDLCSERLLKQITAQWKIG